MPIAHPPAGPAGRLKSWIAKSWTRRCLGVLLLLGVAGALWHIPLRAAEPAAIIPAPAIDAPSGLAGPQTIVLAGGCFWGVQAVFQHVKGVTQAVSGYA